MRRLAPLVEAVAWLTPAVVVLIVVLRYGVNVPSWDQWAILHGLVEWQIRGFPWASNVLGHHNEHRMIFPKLVMLALAELTRWNIIVELLTSVALATGSLVVVAALARPVLRITGPMTRVWSAFTLSAMLFSLTQYGNWLWGWQIQWFLAVFAALLSTATAVWSLRSPRPWLWVAGAIASAVVCSFSLASGVAIWASNALIFVFHARRRVVLPAWLAASACSIALYFVGFSLAGHDPPLSAGVERPLELLIYVANYLAGPLGRFAAYGFLAGISFIALAAVAIARHRQEPELVLPWIAIGAFSVGTAVLTAVGRVGYGSAHALENRYATTGLLLSISLVPLGILAFRSLPGSRWSTLRIGAGAFTAILVTFLVVRADAFSRKPLVAESQKLTDARECILRLDEATDECLTKLYNDAPLVRRWAKQLQAWGWSGFPALPSQPPGTLSIAGPEGARLWRLRLLTSEGVGAIAHAVQDGGGLVVSGWVEPLEQLGASHSVVVTVGDTVKGEAVLVGQTKLFGVTSQRSAWSMRVAHVSSTQEPGRLRAYLTLGDGELTALDGEVIVKKAP